MIIMHESLHITGEIQTWVVIIAGNMILLSFPHVLPLLVWMMKFFPIIKISSFESCIMG